MFAEYYYRGLGGSNTHQIKFRGRAFEVDHTSKVNKINKFVESDLLVDLKPKQADLHR